VSEYFTGITFRALHSLRPVFSIAFHTFEGSKTSGTEEKCQDFLQEAPVSPSEFQIIVVYTFTFSARLKERMKRMTNVRILYSASSRVTAWVSAYRRQKYFKINWF
jgi:hypothetical protein